MSDSMLRISAFRGIDQSRGDYSADASTSPDALNFICRDAALMTAPGMTALSPAPPSGCVRLFQGFFRNADGEDVSRLLASGNGAVYALSDETWLCLGSGFSSDDWCAVNYRHEADDWLILANGKDRMQYWDGRSDSLSPLVATIGQSEVLFSRLTLIYERLWGAVTSDAPDRIYWSESFAPDNWELNAGQSETGGGFADVATFDGSRIRAVIAAFDDVLIFKDKSIHRLNGTYPGDFSLTQVYGSEGTLAARTIVHTATRLYFLGSDGLCVYDGMSASSLAHKGDRRMKNVFERVNYGAVSQACAALFDDVIYLAVPLDGATGNSHVIEYSLADGMWALLDCAGIRDWLVRRDGQTETLLCLTENGLFAFGAGSDFGGQPINARWVSPILTLETRSTRKRTGRIYLSVFAPKPASMKLTMQSESGRAEKVIPLSQGLNIVRKRLRVRGRFIRFSIESADGAPFSLPSGLEIELEEDTDQ